MAKLSPPVKQTLCSLQSRDPNSVRRHCQVSGANEDDVFKALWMLMPKTPVTVADALSQVQDTAWVLDECLAQHNQHLDLATIRALLELVLSISNTLTFNDVEAELVGIVERHSPDSSSESGTPHTRSVPATDLCLARARAVEHLDRLDTFEAIISDLHVNDFGHFCDTNLLVIARDCAAGARISALEVLFTRHGSELLPARMSILELLPECIDPAIYHHLLPHIDVDTGKERLFRCIPWRRPDWTSSPVAKELLDLLLDEDAGGSSRKPPLGIQIIDYPADASRISSWYRHRILQIEARTGLSRRPLGLSAFALERGISGIDALFWHMQILDSITFNCVDQRPESMEMLSEVSLQSLMKPQGSDVFYTFLDGLDDQSILFELRTTVFPLLSTNRTAKHTKGEYNTYLNLLADALARLSSTRPNTVASVLLASSDILSEADRLILSPRIVAGIVIKAFHEHYIPENIVFYRDVIGSLPKWLGGDAQDTSQIAHDESWITIVATTVTQLRQKLKALHMIAAVGLPASIDSPERISGSRSEQHLLVERASRDVIKMYCTAKDATEDRRFWDILGDVFELRVHGMLAMVDDEMIYQKFLCPALTHGLYGFFKNALDMAFNRSSALSPAICHARLPPLGIKTCQTISLAAARELYDNADTASRSDVQLRRATECLLLVPSSPEIQHELDLIDATCTLLGKNPIIDPQTNIPFLPIQIRLHSNKFELVRILLKTHRTLLTSSEQVFDLISKLLGKDYAALPGSRLRAHAYIAEAALEKANVDIASQHAREIVRLVLSGSLHTPGSSAVSLIDGDQDIAEIASGLMIRLAQTDMLDDYSTKLRLVSYAMCICSKENLESLLDFWRTLESKKGASDFLLRAQSTSGLAGHRAVLKLGSFLGSGQAGARKYNLPEDPYEVLEVMFAAITSPSKLHDEANRASLLSPGASHLSTPANDFYQAPGTSTSGGFYDIDSKDDFISSFPATGLSTVLRYQENTCIYHRDPAKILLEYARSLRRIDSVVSLAGFINCRNGMDVNQLKDLISTLVEYSSDHEWGEIASLVFQIEAICHNGGRIATSSDADTERAAAVLAHLPIGQSFAENTDHAGIKQMLDLARKFSDQAETSRSSGLLAGIISTLPEVDLDRIMKDREYGYNVVLSLTHTCDKHQIQHCFEVAQLLGISRDSVIAAHISYLVSSDRVSGDRLYSCVFNMLGLLRKAAPPVHSILLGMHARVVSASSSEKMMGYYKAILDTLKNNGEVNLAGDQQSHNDLAAIIASRSDMFNLICSSPDLHDVRPCDLVRALSHPNEGLRELWSSNPTFARMHALLEICPRLPSFAPTPPIPGELEERTFCFDPALSASTLMLAFYDGLLDHALSDWDSMDSHAIIELVEGVLRDAPKMVPKDAFQVACRLVIGPLASHLSLDIRTSALERLSQLVRGPDFEQELARMRVRLNLLHDLNELDDTFYTEGELLQKLVHELDTSDFENEADQSLISLVCNGASVALAHKAFKIVGRFVPALFSQSSLPDLYDRALQHIVDAMSSNTGLWRTELEKIKQILCMISEWDIDSGPQPSLQKDSDGWLDLDIPEIASSSAHERDLGVEMHDRVQSRLKFVINDGSLLPPEARMALFHIMQQYFDKAKSTDANLHVARLTALVQHIWNIEVPSFDMTDSAQRTDIFDKLISASVSEEHGARLTEFLLVWTVGSYQPISAAHSSATILNSEWDTLFMWMVDQGHDTLLFSLLLVLGSLFTIKDEMILKTIRERRGIAEYYQFCLISSSLETVNQVEADLFEQLEASPDMQELLIVHRPLLLLVLSRRLGAKLAQIDIDWDMLCESVIRLPLVEPSTTPSMSLSAHRLLVQYFLADLCNAQLSMHAAHFAVRYTRSSTYAYSDTRACLSLVTRILGHTQRPADFTNHMPSLWPPLEPNQLAGRILSLSRSPLDLEGVVIARSLLPLLMRDGQIDTTAIQEAIENVS